MKKTPETTPITTALNVDFQDDNAIWLTNSKTLRKLIGILGMSLPLLLYIDNGLNHPLPSISHYYYTRVCSIFVVIMSMLGVFLMFIKEKKCKILFETILYSVHQHLILLAQMF